MEKVIEEKEVEIAAHEVEQRKKTEEQLKKPQVVLHTDSGKKKLESYDTIAPTDLKPTGVEVYREKVGDMDVYDVPSESIPPEERPPEEETHPHSVHHRKKKHKKKEKKHSHKLHHPHKKHEEAPTEEAPEEVPEKQE